MTHRELRAAPPQAQDARLVTFKFQLDSELRQLAVQSDLAPTMASTR